MSTKQSIIYTGRIQDLKTALSVGDVKGALIAAGDVLRRTRVLGVERREIEGELSRLTTDQVMQYVASLKADEMHARLAKGIEEAFEALLADDPNEKAMWQKEAAQALRDRDALESARVAAELRVGRVEALDAKLAAVDAHLAKSAHCLIGLNGMRREELALLDSDESAWWYAARSNGDSLGEVLAGRKNADPALASSAEDKKDIERLASIEVPPKRVDGESLWLKEIGAVSKERSRWAEKHLDAADKKALDVDIE